MRKEVIFAVLAGIVFGLVVAFGIWRANTALKPPEQKTSTSKNIPDSPDSQTSTTLTLASPKQYSVITKLPQTISGLTRSDSWISISAEDQDYITQADSSGSFEQEIDLVGGANQIVVTSFDPDGNISREVLTLVYSTEFSE